MSRLTASLTVHPNQQFRRSRRFYFAYDATWAAVFIVAIAVHVGAGVPAAFGAPTALWALVFPLAVYAVILAQLSIHNAVHGNYPRAVNRVIGEVLGVLVVVRFASWVMVHLRHHRHADDPVNDPHPNFPSFWKTALHTIVHVEKQLMREYYERWGDTAENRAAEARRAKISYAANVALLAAWAVWLGPWFFGLVFLPANVLGALFIIHFNWVTHGGLRQGAFRPVNLNGGWFWLGNKLFAGIYMHKNHHERPHLVNPSVWRTEKLGPAEACADAPAPAEVSPRAAPVSPKTTLTSYGGMRQATPRETLRTREPAAIASLLARAEREGRRVTVRGAGRSFDDQAMGDDVVLDVASMDRIVDFDAVARQITVEPGATWGAIVARTLPAGLLPHVLVTTPWATAGGTLSANCISRSTPKYGHTGDHVRSFDLLTVGGETITCTRSSDPELFHAVIGGFGYFGVVTRITYDLLHIGDRRCVKTEIDRREGLPDFVAHLTETSRAPGAHDAVCSVFSLAAPQRGAVLRSTYTEEPVGKRLFLHQPWTWYRPVAEALFASSTIGNAVCHASYKYVFGKGPFVDDLHGYTFCMEGNERMKALTERAGLRVRSMQPSFSVPTEGLLFFLEETARVMRSFDVYPSLLDALYRPSDRFLLSSANALPGFCVSFMFEAVTERKYRRLAPCLLALNDVCLAAGGRLHLIKNVHATRAQLGAMYAHATSDLARIKSRVDPRGVLVNDFFARAFSC